MVNKSAKALREYANNKCTALVDKDHWVNRLQLTDEHQEHVKQLMEPSPGACNYCGNPAPLHHYIACKPARSHGGGRSASLSPGPAPVRGCVSCFQSCVRTGPGRSPQI